MNPCEQVWGQSIPAGELITVPDPPPVRCTVSVIGGEGQLSDAVALVWLIDGPRARCSSATVRKSFGQGGPPSFAHGWCTVLVRVCPPLMSFPPSIMPSSCQLPSLSSSSVTL